jgi:hypothetical protein
MWVSFVLLALLAGPSVQQRRPYRRTWWRTNVSGRKQHHIPQLLLRGFGVPNGKTARVWLFRKGQAPQNPTTKNAGAERDFYSGPSADGSETLDDRITRYETGFSNLLSVLRGQPVGSIADPTDAAEVVAHLTVRNAHLRDIFRSSVEGLIAGAAGIFADEANLRALFGVAATAPTPRMQELVNKTIAEKSISTLTGLPDPLIHQIVFTLVKESFDQFYAEHAPIIKAGLSEISKNAGGAVRTGHNKALASNLKPEATIEALRHLLWTISAAPEGGAILPDCVALGVEVDNPDPVPYMMTANDRLNTVFLPVCTDKVLIGRRVETPMPDLRTFNEAAAACSHNFFVAANNTPELVGLAGKIGERSQTVALATVSDALDEYRAELFEADPKTCLLTQPITPPATARKQPIDQVSNELHHPQTPSYSVDFPDSGDEEITAMIASVVKAVISELSLLLPLCRLDGVTFARDYGSALLNLERGFPATAALTPTNDDLGVGVAMAPLVMRDGHIRVRVVVRRDLGHALVSDDDSARALAIQVLIRISGNFWTRLCLSSRVTV